MALKTKQNEVCCFNYLPHLSSSQSPLSLPWAPSASPWVTCTLCPIPSLAPFLVSFKATCYGSYVDAACCSYVGVDTWMQMQVKLSWNLFKVYYILDYSVTIIRYHRLYCLNNRPSFTLTTVEKKKCIFAIWGGPASSWKLTFPVSLQESRVPVVVGMKNDPSQAHIFEHPVPCWQCCSGCYGTFTSLAGGSMSLGADFGVFFLQPHSFLSLLPVRG